jgi:hypothetical protein
LTTKVLFIDDRPNEVLNLWGDAIVAKPRYSSEFYLLPVVCFDTEEKSFEMVLIYQPDIIFVGFGLSSTESNGADVIKLLQKINYHGIIVANSGGSIDQFAREGVEIQWSIERSPEKLQKFLEEHLKSLAYNKAKDNLE